MSNECEPQSKMRTCFRRRFGLKRSKLEISGGVDLKQNSMPFSRTESSSSSSLSSSCSPISSGTVHEGEHELETSQTQSHNGSFIKSFSPLKQRRSSTSLDSTDSDQSTRSTSRKGVTYKPDGSIVCCRFCDILQSRDANFVYEDNSIAVFRPLYPVSESHVLVVPRCHIQNVKLLSEEHITLLQRMREVAELVLGGNDSSLVSSCSSPVEGTFAFHTPPFNSIDHVHMHVFKANEKSGFVGTIKYKTETWWCRSYDEVMARLGKKSPNSMFKTVNADTRSC